MLLGMSLPAFTLLHVVISLIGIASGLVVLFGLLNGKPLDKWAALFLATTVVTSVTGFLFPVEHFLPSHAIGILSLIALAVAIFARYSRLLAGGWRRAYVISAVVALYFNVFVAIAQSFQKVPALKALAPTQSEPPFLVTQLVVMAIFIAVGIFAVKRFRTDLIPTPSPELGSA